MKKILSILVGLNFVFFGAFSYATADHDQNPDQNDDGYISVAEGVPFYGSVQASLTTEGDTSPDSALALDRFPTADDRGDLDYDETFEVSDEVIDALEDEDLAVVLHGIDINGNGEYDGAKESSLDEGVPFEATVPAACGIAEDSGSDEYEVDLEELNSSAVNGNVEIEIEDEDDGEIRVMIDAEDLSAGLPHAQHFHFGTNGECPPNTDGVDQELTEDMEEGSEDEDNDEADAQEADENNDNFISVAEGVPFYGAVVASLTTEGDTSAESALALDRFPSADENGDLDYERTFEVSDEVREAIEDGDAAVVQHGIDLSGNGEYDGDKESSLDEDVPFEATVPAACGIVGDDDDMYTATLSELNSSGVSGDVEIELDGNDVTLRINSEDLSQMLPHAQHFHVGGDNVCPPNSEGADQDVDVDEDREDLTLEEKIDLLREKIQNFTDDLTAYINSLA